MTLTRKTLGTFNPVTGTDATPTTATYTVYGVLGGKQPDANLIAGGMVRSGDSVILMAAGVVAPLSNDTLTIGGVVHTVIAVFGQAPSNIDLFYSVWVRK